MEARSKKGKGPDQAGDCFHEPGFLMEKGGPNGRREEEFAVCGYFCSEAGRTSLVLGKFRGDGPVFKGQVTAGVNAKDCERLRIGECPFKIYPASLQDTVWCAPTHVGIVEYTRSGSSALHHPVFKGFRDDVYQWEKLNSEI